ncbi:MAG: zinc ribbon domain-containing protein [Polyangiaceae bacterium]
MSIFSRLFRKGQEGGDGDDAAAALRKCAKCGATSEAGAAFCGECGNPIGPQPAGAAPAAGATATQQPVTASTAGRYSFTSDAPARDPAAPAPAPRSPSSSAQLRPSLSDAALAELFAPNETWTSPQPTAQRPRGTKEPTLRSALGQPPAVPPVPPVPTGGKAHRRDQGRRAQDCRQEAGRAAEGRRAGQAAARRRLACAASRRQRRACIGRQAAPAPVATSQQPLTMAPLSERQPRHDAPTPLVPQVSALDATPLAPAGAKSSGDSGFQKMLDDLDEGFDSIVRSDVLGGPNGVPSVQRGMAAPDVRELFLELAAEFARPVRDFMIEMRWNDPRREWLAICVPAVRSLKRSAETMEMADLSAALGGYLTALEEAQTSPAAILDEAERAPLLRAYQDLAKVMPDGFSLEAERDRREPIIVQSLLLQVPEVRKVTLDKLYAAGLTNLSMYFASKPDDIAFAAGLDTALAARIVERFHRYKRELEAPPDETRSRERAQLAELTETLSQLTQEYERAASDWSKQATADKRRLRQEREEVLLSVTLLLARLGEVDRVRALETLPFQAKVKDLQAYLNESAQRARASGRLQAGDGSARPQAGDGSPRRQDKGA